MNAAAPQSPLVHLVDDDAGVRDALARLIATVGLRVQPWADPQAFLAGFDRSAIGVVVLDVRMPGLSGLTVLERLRAEGADQPVVMLTGHGTVELCRRAFKGGAAEFLEKPVDDDLLLDALQQAIRSHVRSRERRRADEGARERYAQLSPREREVLSLIVAGLTNKETGRALALSPRTVETHRAHLFAKLQAESLAALVRHYALLVDEDGGGARHPYAYGGRSGIGRMAAAHPAAYSAVTVAPRPLPTRRPRMKTSTRALVLGAFVACVGAAAQAQAVRSEKNMSLELATRLASATVAACQANGHAVTATVVDRAGQVRFVHRADNAGPHTLGASAQKAFTSASARNATLAMMDNAQKNPEAANLVHIPGFLLLGGGVPVRAGGEVIGAIGVGGAPGGHLDEQCAVAALEQAKDLLQ